MLAEEGRVLEALQAFSGAVRLAPDDPYIRIEYAELLLRVSQRYGGGNGRLERLTEAERQAEEARKRAPDNLDVLRALGRIELSLAEVRPDALPAAIAALEAVRRQAPFDIQTMVTLGQIYLQQEQPGLAADVFQEVASYTPGSRMVYSFLADALTAAGRDAEAEQPLRRLLEIDPQSLDSRLKLAKLLAGRGDHAGAVEVLREVSEGAEENRELRSELIWQLYLAGDFEAALARAEAEVASEPEEVWPRFVRALIKSAQGRTEEALAELDALRADEPKSLELARTTAGLLEREGRPAAAAEVLGDLIARLEAAADPASEESRSQARFLLAGIQRRAGDRQAAATTLEPLLSAQDDQVRGEAKMSYADLLFDLGQRDRALAVVEEGAVDFPPLRAKELELLLRAGEERRAKRLVDRLSREDDPELLVMAAQAAQSQQRYELSLPLLERALAADSRRVEAQFLAGAAYERTGQLERAVATFRRLLDGEPAFAPALNYLGYMWAERGENLAEALALVQRAVDLDPDNGAYVDSLGWAHFQLGDYDEARRQLERAADLIPDDPTIAEHLGDVYAALGETARAEQLYRRALELVSSSGDEADVRRKLDRLQAD